MGRSAPVPPARGRLCAIGGGSAHEGVISSDVEGTAGIVDWSQCLPGESAYESGRELLLGEVNAAIDGACAAGATGFLVNDSHSSMANLPPQQLHAQASYLSGKHKPLYMMQGLDATFDAVFFVSYHGSMGDPCSTLSHTYNPRAIAEVRVNGVVAGEAGINALVALGHGVPVALSHGVPVALGHGVPVALVTGDEVTAAEAAPFCPGVEQAVVNHSVSRFAAESLHPELARPHRGGRPSGAGAARGVGRACDQPASDVGGALAQRRSRRDVHLAPRCRSRGRGDRIHGRRRPRTSLSHLRHRGAAHPRHRRVSRGVSRRRPRG